METDIQKVWEKRSRLFGTDKKSVMEQSFPRVVNEYIEKIHIREIENILETKKKVLCLDAGCGYGRITSQIAKRAPNIFIYGIDISSTFVSLYNKRMKKRGKAIVGDLRKLPFKDEEFDYLWTVAVFMYLETEKDQKKGMKEVFRVLKPGGKVVIIEPNLFGVQLVRLGGFLPHIYRFLLNRSKVETFGIAFPWLRIDSLVRHSGGRLLYKRGYPLLTISLLPCILLGKIIPQFTKFILIFVTILDRYFPFSRASYFITYGAIKE